MSEDLNTSNNLNTDGINESQESPASASSQPASLAGLGMNPLDTMMREIIDIFNNIEGVELVRLNGLTKHSIRIAGTQAVDKELIDTIVHKLKRNNIIHWKYEYECPYCHEVFYQVKDVPSDSLKICDTCESMFIPKNNIRYSPTIL